MEEDNEIDQISFPFTGQKVHKQTRINTLNWKKKTISSQPVKYLFEEQGTFAASKWIF